jgi:ribonuclease P protein component
MIGSKRRFHGNNSLNFVYKRGQTLRSPQLSLKYVRNERREVYRAAVVVSRKVHKSAVVRNRIRRRIYEIIRTQEPVMTQVFDLVFTVFSEDVAIMPSIDLQKIVIGQLRKSGVMAKPKPPEHDIVEAKYKG